jgi:hypothetical protein
MDDLMSMTDADTALRRVSEIDEMFDAAHGWGSWMVDVANERERLVDGLRRNGYSIDHKWRARCGGYRTS